MNTDFIPYGMTIEETLRYHRHALPAPVAEQLEDALQERDDRETERDELQVKLDDMEGERDTAQRDLAELRTAIEDAIGQPKTWPKMKKAGLLELLAAVREALE